MSSSYLKTKKNRRPKSKTKTKKSNMRFTRKNNSYLKKLQLDEKNSRSIIREYAKKTPIVSMGHSVKLLTKSKKEIRKGNLSNAMASLLTAVAVLSATGPFQQHPNVKTNRMAKSYKGRWTGDPEELMKWHVEENFNPSLKQTTRRKGKAKQKTKRKKKKPRSKTRKTQI